MARKKAEKVQAVGAATEPPPTEPPAQPAVFRFWNKVRCPHCGSLSTRAYATSGSVQYRKCEAPVCRRPFKAMGEPI